VAFSFHGQMKGAFKQRQGFCS